MSRLFRLSALILTAALLACSSGGSGSSGSPNNSGTPITLSGTVTSQSPAPGSAAPAATAVNKVIGYQVAGINTVSGPASYAEANVDANGAFQLTVNSGGSNGGAVLMLLDTTKTRKIDQVVSFLALGDSAGGDGLIKLPLGTAQSSVNLGSIAALTGLSNMLIQDMTGSLGSTVELMRELARTDALLRNLKNEYANVTDNSYYFHTPGFEWGRSYQDAVNAADWFDPATYGFKGFQLFFMTNDPAFQDDAICTHATSTNHVALVLTPPAPVTMEQVDFFGTATSSQTVTAFTNDLNEPLTATTCGSAPGGGATIADTCYLGKDGVMTNFNWGGGGIRSPNLPADPWTLSLGGVEKAHFDIRVASPLDDTGNPIVYVPSVKIVSNASGIIERLSIRFYLWDGAAYAAVIDPTVMLQQISAFNVAISDVWTPTNAASSDSMTPVHTGGGIFEAVPAAQFYTPDKKPSAQNNSDVADSVGIGYSMHGSGVRFDLRW